MHAATVAISELHEAVFADHLTRVLGVEWELRAMGRNRNPGWAISSVPESLAAEFSTRSRHLDVETDRLVEDYVERHGRRPNAAVIMKLRAQATLSTRPEKTLHSLADLTSAWRDRASTILDEDATAWAQQVTSNDRLLLFRADDIPLDVIRSIRSIGESVVAAVGVGLGGLKAPPGWEMKRELLSQRCLTNWDELFVAAA